MPEKKQVVITGIGAVSPLGCNANETWAAARQSRSGITALTRFDPSAHDCRIAGEVKSFTPPGFVEKKEARRLDDFVLFALAAADEAMRDAGVRTETLDPARCGVIIGSGIGGLNIIEQEHAKLLQAGPGRVSPFLIPMLIPDIAAGRVAMQFGFRGANLAVVSACASGAHALGTALRAIQDSDIDLAVSGGTESCITPLGLAGFCSMKALSLRNTDPAGASRPFERDRDGFVMAEGAGILILEEESHALARGAKIYARFTGYGASADAYHITAPDPEGKGMILAMETALRDAGIKNGRVDYINAHGTSTSWNDLVETRAIRQVFGSRAHDIPVSSTKSMTGHMLGAAGAVELVFCCFVLRDGIIPATINYETPDPDCDLDYVPNAARTARVTKTMSNSFGFGGHNATLILEKY
jgi:3-oxoacyl-[acyl-carrier-protein] synthase II